MTFTITGTNDAPVMSDTTNPAAVVEIAGDSSAQNLSAITGSFAVSDQDVGDTLTLSVVGSPLVQLNGGAVATAGRRRGADRGRRVQLRRRATSNGGAASIGYSYDPAAADLDLAAGGRQLTITYPVQVNDGTGNAAPRT